MWRGKGFPDYLTRLSQIRIIQQVIIIDNNKEMRPRIDSQDPGKIQILEMDSNIFVSPAWNLGVSCSKGEVICLLNDDCPVKEHAFALAYALIMQDKDNIGIIGLDWHNQTGNLTISKVNQMQGHGFGSCMFLHHKNYVPIPNDMLIWYGGNVIFYTQLFAGKSNFALTGFFEVAASTATTLSEIRADVLPILRRDSRSYIYWLLRNSWPEFFREISKRFAGRLRLSSFN